MKDLKKFETLVNIMSILRAPDGCPWDREQDLNTLKPYLLEETYELLEVMEHGGYEHKEELGDLLLQIIFQSQIQSENREFNIYDVIETLNEKLIRRHPHIFSDEKLENSEEVKKKWDEIKKEEKNKLHRESILDGIPVALPPILKAKKIQSKAAKVGFDWNNVEGAIDKMEEELEEFREAYKNQDIENMKEEIGDVLFSIVNVARLAKIDPYQSLMSTIDKFDKRFRYIEKNTDIKKASLEEMEKLWEEAKGEIG